MTNKKKYILRVELTSWDEEFRYATYSNFVIGNVLQKYPLTIGTYSGDAGCF
jgi:hypothetical protein